MGDGGAPSTVSPVAWHPRNAPFLANVTGLFLFPLEPPSVLSRDELR